MSSILFVARKEDHLSADDITLRLSGHKRGEYDYTSEPASWSRFSVTYAFSEQEVKEALKRERFDAALFLGLSLPKENIGYGYSNPEVQHGLETLNLLRNSRTHQDKMPIFVLSRSLEHLPPIPESNLTHTNKEAYIGYLRTSLSSKRSGTLVLKGYNS